ncbi:MAG: two-component system sensor histidine kinase NtrB [Gammaproteobacteria bacterium]|jgi:two-component system nitrogen regulation sensor histidine kinase GlnL|nr:ATP-binding protein [Gammaproteobacteria bacterium]MDO7562244.1 ATP-binding protein [SAR86 cluster bacterium]MDA9175013.1 ATP-binding protein [Gammaproteobacteria bacterium]MDA9782544.1 ATP-binding protein [Gammaproteobacteria bacterium]MDA9868904.1 ATP-binding protein [Gammaproteobacteria bacterium]|tara:strand:- start:406 stop:1491 length:1086 start_codon:yes stop_codon:yes gene_type:complete
MNTQEFEALNGLNTEVIILDAKDLSVIWLNDSAKAANWIPESSAHELKDIFSFIDDEAENQIKEILLQAKKNASAITRRDFIISDSTGQVRTLDLTISYADKKNLIYIEALSTENLNKIIDSTRSFSTQKIAAGLARTLAHEVKNPLSGIKGSAQILKSKYSDDFSKKFLKIIEDETDRLNEIVTKILTPAKKPSFAYFNLHETLQRVLALTNAEANDNLNIERDYDPSIPEIYGDKNLFIQAVINIVRNALQACSDFSETPQLGIKTHITYRQPINGNIHATLAEIEISDNGPGIDSELHDQIFFPMVSSKESGSGIGLSIAQDIIRIHGGAISFDRKNNQTIFSILIPISNNIQKAQSA